MSKHASLESVLYTVAVPAFCEEHSMVELADRVAAVFTKMGYQDQFEILFVDDGSTDGTRDVLRQLAEERPFVRLLGFRRNHGKSLALMAAFTYARGQHIITIDADLQDNPEDIPKLTDKLAEGYDLVSGWRDKRQDGIIRTIYSGLFNKTVALVSGLGIHDFNCGFKLYKREVLEKIQVFGQLHRFIPYLAHAQGFKVGETLVHNSERKYGTSRFPAVRFAGVYDLFSIFFISRYSFSPLHFFGKVGLFMAVPSAAVFLFLIAEHVVSWFGYIQPLVNRPLFMLSLVGMLLGVNVFLTGFVCDFVLHHGMRNNLRGILDGMIDEER